MTEPTAVRLIRSTDAQVLLDHLCNDRADLKRWDPARPAEFHTLAGQQQRIERLLGERHEGRGWPGVIECGPSVIGQVSITAIVGEPFRKASLGYWVASGYQGRGHARRAIGLALAVMRDELGLHRAEASTRLDNLGSQAVLRRHGFSTIGTAHAHSHIDGAWRDVLLWERVLGAAAHA